MAQLDTAPGAPVFDPAGVAKTSEPRRIGDRRSATPVESGAMPQPATDQEGSNWNPLRKVVRKYYSGKAYRYGSQTARQNCADWLGSTALVTFSVLAESLLVATELQLARLVEL